VIHSSVQGQKYERRRGFTLVELLVVMVVLALAMSIATPLIQKANTRARLDAALSSLYDGIRRARASAIASGSMVEFDIRKMVRDGAIAIETGQTPATALVFYPDGSATSARIRLGLDGERRSLSIDWLTGHAGLVE